MEHTRAHACTGSHMEAALHHDELTWLKTQGSRNVRPNLNAEGSTINEGASSYCMIKLNSNQGCDRKSDSKKSSNDNKDGNNHREQGQGVAMVAMMRRSCNTHMHMHAQVHKSRQLCTMMDAHTRLKTQGSRHVHDCLLIVARPCTPNAAQGNEAVLHTAQES